MSLISLSASSSSIKIKEGDNKQQKQQERRLLYDHTQFNEAIEVVIKMLDDLDHYDRLFVEDE